METLPIVDCDQALGFQFLENVKDFVEEHYYQVKSLSNLSLPERQRLFANVSRTTLMQVLKFLYVHEKEQDPITQNVVSQLIWKLLRTLEMIQQEEEEQKRLGLHHSPELLKTHIQSWKRALVQELQKMDLPVTIEQRLRLKLLSLGKVHQNMSQSLVVSDESESLNRLEELFFRSFEQGEVRQEMLMKLLSRDFDEVLDFLQSKIEKGACQEKLHSLEVLKCIGHERSLLLISRMSLCEDLVIRAKAKQILLWARDQAHFEDHQLLLTRFLNKIKELEQRRAREEDEKRLQAREELILFQYRSLQSEDPVEKIRFVTSIPSQEYHELPNFLEEFFASERDDSLAAKVLRRAISEGLFQYESVCCRYLSFGRDSLVFQILQLVRDYQMSGCVEAIRENQDRYKKINASMAEQTLLLLESE